MEEEASVSEPHAASVMTNDAAQAMSATEEVTRKEFTVVTLPRRHAVFAGSPDGTCGLRWSSCGSTCPRGQQLAQDLLEVVHEHEVSLARHEV